MNTIQLISDDNLHINHKNYVLDPLSVIIKLAILSNKPVGTKLLIHNNIISLQEPGPFQSFCRVFYHSNKSDIHYLYNPISLACQYFLSKSTIDKFPRLRFLFESAQLGLLRLIETYKNCSVIVLILIYYNVLLTNHINQTYNDTMFSKDGISGYYKPSVVDDLVKQWTDKKIKVVLDIIMFLRENENPQNNVKSLDTIMLDIDVSSQNIVNGVFYTLEDLKSHT